MGKDFEFSNRGLIKISKNKYAKNWEDLFSLKKRDTKDKKKRFKAKYKDLIKEVSFQSNGRNYTYLVALPELTHNKYISDLQNLAMGKK